ncbi:MAG TPA: hypothetical protein VLH35_05660 [Candidatus Acidoferrales bacterium]|nr:hypothetical protein [Candidatus Acidoferrales bacterium]
MFGKKLSEIENRLNDNTVKTKQAFPEETDLIESGLDLMFNLTRISKEVHTQYPDNPHFYTNHNLFVRNRQLLLQAYISCLSSSYGTEFVILRTILENNNLMRLFNKKPDYAFDWLPKDFQKRFTSEAQTIYGQSGKHDQTYDPFPVIGWVFDDKQRKKVRRDINKLYGQLCNYSHPNFGGWHELIAFKDGIETIERLPNFSPTKGKTSLGLFLFIMQLTFKSYVDTFGINLVTFADDLRLWQLRNIDILYKIQTTT